MPTPGEPLVQCSPDLGASWAPPIHFTAPSATLPEFAAGTAKAATGSDDVISLSWTDNPIIDGGGVATVYVATVTTDPVNPNPAAVPTLASSPGQLTFPADNPDINPFPTTDIRYDANGVLWLVYWVAPTVLTDPLRRRRQELRRRRPLGRRRVRGDRRRPGELAGPRADPRAAVRRWNGHQRAVGAPPLDGGANATGELLYRLSP